MSAPDPANPKVGDMFSTYHGPNMIVVLFVADEGSVIYRYTQASEVFLKSAEQFARHYRPVPEPLITEPMTLWRSTFDGVHTWSFSPCWGNASITILPDGTWFEGQPPHKSQGEQS